MSTVRFLPAFLSGALLLIPIVAVHADAAKAETTPPASSETSGPSFRSGVEKRAFELINDYRQSHDLPLLAWNEEVARVARAHSKDMATGDVAFGHAGFSDRAREVKSTASGFRGIGENVFYTSQLEDVAHSAVTAWLHSPHHLANIRGDYNYSGLGVWQGKDDVIYFTQIFVKAEVP